jgi:hypothetical protein
MTATLLQVPESAISQTTSRVKAIEMVVTPTLAEQWLGKNTSNRRVRHGVVSRYAHDMTQGAWRLTTETIKFDENGNLLDGQHRLLACIESDTSFVTMVATGVEKDAFIVMDSGAGRTVADMLRQLGYTDVHNLAAMIAHLIRYETYGTFHTGGSRAPSRSQILQYLSDHEEPVLRSLHTSSRRIPGLRPSMAAALHYLFDPVNDEDNAAFWERLHSGEGLEKGNPILALRRRLADNATSTRKLPPNEEAALTIKAWNLWRQGREVQVLTWRPGGANPEKFPTIQ